jgi:hypothetical protein
MTPRSLTWDRALAWRLRRQLLDPIGSVSAPAIVRALCGVQAQVPSAAELAVAVRQAPPQAGSLAGALTDRTVFRTWAMRGTLHVLAPDHAGAFLSLVGAIRTWGAAVVATELRGRAGGDRAARGDRLRGP